MMNTKFYSLSILLLFLTAVCVPQFVEAQSDSESQQILLTKGYKDGSNEYPLIIYTTQKAHLAAFLVAPDQGVVTLLYPNEFQKDDLVEAGQLRVTAAPYTNAKYTTDRSFPKSGLLNQKKNSNYSKKFFLVVSSETPFPEAPFEGSPQEFKKRFRGISFDIDKSQEKIVSALIPENHAGEVKTDMVIY